MNTQFKFKNSQSSKPQFDSIWLISIATTPGQGGPGSDGNEEVLSIPQSSSITGTSPSDCLVIQYTRWGGGLSSPQRSSRCILHLQPTGQGECRVTGSRCYRSQFHSGPVWKNGTWSIGQIELFDIKTEWKQMTYADLNSLK